MTEIIKAVRGQVFLGDIPLDVYMLPDGSYRLSGRGVTDAVGENSITLIRKMGVKALKDLPNADLERYKINPGKEGSPFFPVSIKDATLYWIKCVQDGNAKAVAVSAACMNESIERRADAFFGVTRIEQDRNRRFKDLVDFILANPKEWTMHFKPQWQREACRVTGYNWHPSRPMAQFISTYIYKALPKEVYEKLMIQNADRKSRHHQFFDDVADELVLKEHIQQVGGLLRVSRNKTHFKQLFKDAYGDGIQGILEVDQVS